MSIRDKYNKDAKDVPARKIVAEELLQNDRNTEIKKAGNTELKKATFVLDAALHKKLKLQAAKEDRNMAEIVADALNLYFKGL